MRPEICVGAVVVDDDHLLLVRRGRGAAAGTWSVPGGRIEAGETAHEAVLRELREETSIDGVCGELIGWAELISEEHHAVVLDFAVTLLEAADPVAGDDAAEARWVPLWDVADMNLAPGLAEFLHDHDILVTIV